MAYQGLTYYEAKRRLVQYGPNQITAEHHLPGVVSFLGRLTNPLIIILLLAATLAAFLGDVVSFVLITGIVFVSVVLDFANTYRSQKAAEDLKNQVRVTCKVIREGKEQEIPLTHLVPGDIVAVAAGDLIPGDGKLLDGKDVYVSESALTGESFPQGKTADSPVYMGSSLTSGSGFIAIQATGQKTRFSKIAASLNQRQFTEFDREIRSFSVLIIKITIVLVVGIFLVNTLFRHNFLESLLFSLALAVGLTPSLLPLIITLNLTKGSLKMARHGVIVKKLSAIQNFGSMDVLCTDKTGTLTEDKIVLIKYVNGFGQTSDDVLRYAYLASVYSTSYESPLDRAVKEFRHLSREGYKRNDEIPFTFERKRESVVVTRAGEHTLITKGAPEAVFAICATNADGNTFADAERRTVTKEYEQLSSDGFRVLAIATKKVTTTKNFEPKDETAMVFQGFVAFLDPAKKSVTQTLERIALHNVEVKIISGDNALVNQRIATEIKLKSKGLLTGDDIDKLNDDELAKKAEQTTIFARVSPEQKLRIIKILQRQSHVVGYLGDGINDAPALKAADIGISVNNAVDVAKDTADLILLHKSLAELTDGLIEGRKTFTNTLKYLMMSLSSNFGNMFSMAGASLFLPFLPMLAPQILLNNLLYDVSQFALPSDNVDAQTVQRPHRLSIKGIRKFMFVFGILSSLFDFATFGVLLLVLHLGEHGFQAGWFLESMLTQVFVVYIIRTKRVPFIQSRPSWPLIFSTLGVAIVACLAVLSPIAPLLKFSILPGAGLWWIGAIVAVYLVAAQLVKVAFYKRVVLDEVRSAPLTHGFIK